MRCRRGFCWPNDPRCTCSFDDDEPPVDYEPDYDEPYDEPLSAEEADAMADAYFGNLIAMMEKKYE